MPPRRGMGIDEQGAEQSGEIPRFSRRTELFPDSGSTIFVCKTVGLLLLFLPWSVPYCFSLVPYARALLQSLRRADLHQLKGAACARGLFVGVCDTVLVDIWTAVVQQIGLPCLRHETGLHRACSFMVNLCRLHLLRLADHHHMALGRVPVEVDRHANVGFLAGIHFHRGHRDIRARVLVAYAPVALVEGYRKSIVIIFGVVSDMHPGTKRTWPYRRILVFQFQQGMSLVFLGWGVFGHAAPCHEQCQTHHT